jgi:hypothetical protein
MLRKKRERRPIEGTEAVSPQAFEIWHLPRFEELKK